jgi:uncharacterized membrane protein
LARYDLVFVGVLAAIDRISRAANQRWLTPGLGRLTGAVYAIIVIAGAWALWWHAPAHPAGFWLLVKWDYAVVIVFFVLVRSRDAVKRQRRSESTAPAT